MSPSGGKRKGAGRKRQRTHLEFVGFRLTKKRKAWLSQAQENGFRSASDLVRKLLDYTYPLD